MHLVVDTPPDFREQALDARIPRVDAVLFTHAHADHIFGFDDIRRFNTIQGAAIPAYAAPETIRDLHRVFDYIGVEKMPGLYRPRVEYHEVSGPFQIGPVRVTPLAVTHGPERTLGFRFECEGRTLGYVPDCRAMPPNAEQSLRGVDIMILDGLRHRPHQTHLTVAESVKILQQIKARRSFIVHMCHDLDHSETQKDLPAGIEVSYDGLSIEW